MTVRRHVSANQWQHRLRKFDVPDDVHFKLSSPFVGTNMFNGTSHGNSRIVEQAQKAGFPGQFFHLIPRPGDGSWVGDVERYGIQSALRSRFQLLSVLFMANTCDNEVTAPCKMQG
jgi:hypothetical protein